MVSTDKREWKRSMKCPTSGGTNDLQPLSPPEEDVRMFSLSVSPFSNLNNTRLRHLSEPGLSGSDEENQAGNVMVGAVSRLTLFNLGAVLNLSYPDYDFSQTKSASFTLHKFEDVVQNVNGKFCATVNGYLNIRDELWKAVDDAVKIDDCVIYSYIPGYNSDPFTEDGCIWSFNYLLWNKSLKRFLIFACRALCSQNLDVSAEQLWVIDDQ
ncbi:Maf1 regulator [Aphelenchoides avenae]|nr:Maf1 regulator [Aphelenchus avenae]